MDGAPTALMAVVVWVGIMAAGTKAATWERSSSEGRAGWNRQMDHDC